ncbi:hypothetical protein PsYK624_111690 [Phanerochaete sordida]|uniref:Transmembrane protein n=1 Tax=Phanerochaete sordida TaxID=48140 RepID=A0A9P3LGY3_9APHY|nr:hypothetical protein PsYK624_111690 [Phanerochaete sordida]
MRYGLVAALCWVLAVTSGISAQTTTANCSAEFSWANNNLDQSICLIAAYLRAACCTDPTSYVLGTPQADHYGPPTHPDLCTCSTVYYNAISACALCQGQKLLSWSASVYPVCPQSEITVAGYPHPIPSGTAVPAWTYLNIPNSDEFDVSVAQEFIQTNGTMIISKMSSNASSTSSVSTSSVTHNLNAAALAGGFVGAIAGVALLASIVVFWLRQRSRNKRFSTLLSPSPFAARPFPFMPPGEGPEVYGEMQIRPATRSVTPMQPPSYSTIQAPASHGQTQDRLAVELGPTTVPNFNVRSNRVNRLARKA